MKRACSLTTASLALICAAMLHGCATTERRAFDWNNESAIREKITAKADDFDKTVAYVGPNCAQGIGESTFLRAWRDRAGATTFQLYIVSGYEGEWRFYSRAFDSDGKSLPVTVIDRSTGYCDKYGCSKEEHIGLSVTRDYLKAHADSGVRVKLYGKAGEHVANLTGAYVRAFLVVPE